MSAFTSTAFAAASHDDPALGNWYPSTGSADAELIPALPTITPRARDLVKNNALGSGAIQTLKDNVVGSQLRLSAQPKAKLLGWGKDFASEWSNNTEAQYSTWADTTECDAARTQTFLGITAQAFASAMMNGEALAIVMWLPRADGRWSTRLQTIESDRLATPPWLTTDKTVRGGIKIDAYGAPIGYWIQKQHPGDNYVVLSADQNHWEYIPAFTPWGRRRVIHLYDKERSGQSRGRSVFTAVMREFKMAGDYLGHELQAAMLNAMIAMMIETDLPPDSVAELFGTDFSDGSYYQGAAESINKRKMSGGTYQVVPAGFKGSDATAARPNVAFSEFMDAIDLRLAAGLNMPRELFLKDFSKTNYSSARAALIEAWRYFTSRRKWLQDQWINPIYEAWMEEAVNLDRVDAPNYYDNKFAYQSCRWVFSGRGSIDPVKDARAAELRLSMSHSTQQDECAELGKDYEEVQEQRVRELKQAMDRVKALGLPPESAYYIAGFSKAGVDSLATIEDDDEMEDDEQNNEEREEALNNE